MKFGSVIQCLDIQDAILELRIKKFGHFVSFYNARRSTVLALSSKMRSQMLLGISSGDDDLWIKNTCDDMLLQRETLNVCIKTRTIVVCWVRKVRYLRDIPRNLCEKA